MGMFRSVKLGRPHSGSMLHRGRWLSACTWRGLQLFWQMSFRGWLRYQIGSQADRLISSSERYRGSRSAESGNCSWSAAASSGSKSDDSDQRKARRARYIAHPKPMMKWLEWFTSGARIPPTRTFIGGVDIAVVL